MRSTVRAFAWALLLGAVAAPPAASVAPSGAAAAEPTVACQDTPGEIDNSPAGPSAATVISSPRRSVGGVPAAGVVQIRTRTGRNLLLTSASVGLRPTAGGWFGAMTDVNSLTSGDHCGDLVIGAPGLQGGRGGVVVVPDFGKGLEPAAAQWMPTRSLALKRGDRLGSAVASAGGLLVAGAPGRDAPKARDAGALVSWAITTDDGAPSRTINAAKPVTHVQGSGGIQGRAEAGDRFGSVLYLAGLEGELTLAVGIPDEDIGPAKDAGAVALLTWTDAGEWFGDNQLLWQGHGRPGWYRLPGTSRAGDRLGAAVNYMDKKGAFGVPGKDADGRKDSGAILVWRGSLATGKYHLITQNTRGVPDRSEKRDAFGSAIVMRQDCGQCQVLAIGAPGEDQGRRRDTGAVTHVMVQDWDGNAVLRSWRQPARGLAAGDRFGSRLLGDWWKSGPALLVGAPGEDTRTARDAGRYYQAKARGIRPVATGVSQRELMGG